MNKIVYWVREREVKEVEERVERVLVKKVF